MRVEFYYPMATSPTQAEVLAWGTTITNSGGSTLQVPSAIIKKDDGFIEVLPLMVQFGRVIMREIKS